MDAVPPPTHHPTHIHTCKVLPTRNAFTFLVNAMLGFLALSSLLLKRRFFEKKQKRSLRIFILDASRLFISGSTGHLWNLILSTKLNETGLEDECQFYLVNYLLDFFFGVPLIYFFLFISSLLAERYNWTSLKRRGYYYTTQPLPAISYFIWFKQTLEFAFVITLSKTTLAIPLFLFKKEFEPIGQELVSPVVTSPRLELFFVMICIPMFVNAITFLIFDAMLKDDVTGVNNSQLFNFSSNPEERIHLLHHHHHHHHPTYQDSKKA